MTWDSKVCVCVCVCVYVCLHPRGPVPLFGSTLFLSWDSKVCVSLSDVVLRSLLTSCLIHTFAAGAKPSWVHHKQTFDFAIFSIFPDVPVCPILLIFRWFFHVLSHWDFHDVSVFRFYFLVLHWFFAAPVTPCSTFPGFSPSRMSPRRDKLANSRGKNVNIL